MARALLVALAWCAVHGEEYGGGAMPQYGGVDYRVVGDDYRGHARDAPAPLDYKYEEEPPGDTEKPSKYVDDAGRWRKSGRRRTVRDDVTEEIELQGNDADAADMLSKPKTSQRRSRLGSRGRRDKAWRDEPTRNEPERDVAHDQPPARRRAAAGSYSRVKHVGDDVDHYLDNIDYRNDRSNIEDDERIAPLEKTARVIRRKPRDRRLYAPLPVVQTTQLINAESLEAQIANEDLNPNRRMKELAKAEESLEYGWNSGADERERSPLGRARPVAEIANDIERAKQQRFRLRQPPQEYSDYYDIKKKNNERTQLPPLPRRTTTSSARLHSPGRTTLSARLQQLWTARRAGSQPKNIISFDDVVGPPVDTGDPPVDAGGPPNEAGGPPDDAGGPPDDAGGLIEDVSGPPDDDDGPFDDGVLTPTPTPDKPTTRSLSTSNVTITTTTTITTPAATEASMNATVLSMAEKSRLSILKKAQMKERVKGPGTKKPAVLLRVTDRVPTVVLVEPITKADPWMRAREVSGDPPETLDLVKRLMRKKLVAGAKNIRELTDNWDDTVCDYIDVGLLEQELRASAAPPSAQPALVVILCVLAVLYSEARLFKHVFVWCNALCTELIVSSL